MFRDDIQTLNDFICKNDPSLAELDAWQRMKNKWIDFSSLINDVTSGPMGYGVVFPFETYKKMRKLLV